MDEQITSNQPIDTPSKTHSQHEGVVEGQLKKFPWFVVIVIFLMGILGVGGWLGYQKYTTQQTAQTKQLYAGKIIIGYVEWPGLNSLFIARDKELFKQNGINVEVRRYDGLTDLSKDYISGKIQAKTNLVLDTIDEVSKGTSQKTIIAEDYSDGADGIAARSDIKSIDQIKGKRVGYEFGTLEEFFLRYALDQYHMSIQDVTPVNLASQQAAEALGNGTIDVAVTYEPFMSQAIEKIHGNKIYSSAKAPGLITDIITFRSDFIDTHPEAVQAFVKTYFDGITYWKEHPQEANIILAKELGVKPEEAPGQLDGIKVLNLADNITAFTFATGLQSLYGNFRQINRFVQSQNPNTKAIDTDTLIDPSFVRNLNHQ